MVPLLTVLFHLHLLFVLQRDEIVGELVVVGQDFTCATEDFDGFVSLFDLLQTVRVGLPEQVLFFVEALLRVEASMGCRTGMPLFQYCVVCSVKTLCKIVKLVLF